jgi:hypothetical protein
LAKLSQDGALTGEVIAWDGSKWSASSAGGGAGDITSIIVGSGIAGGGESGDVAVYIPPDGITAIHIAPNAVGSSELQANSVGSAHILPGAVSSSDLAVSSVGSSEIADNSILSTDIQDEPGMAQTRNVDTVSLINLAMTDLATLTITIPNSGFIFLTGRSNLRFYGATNPSTALLQIDETSGGTQIAGQFTSTGLASYLSIGDYKFNCTSQRTYFKNAGIYTFRLEGIKVISVPQSIVEASTSVLTAIYLPTSYGTVQTVKEGSVVPEAEN